MSAIRRRWRFTGTVQGVGFRYYARAAALHLGLTGWVANNWDGSVTLEAQGERAALDALVPLIERSNRWARIENVEVHHPARKGTRIRVWGAERRVIFREEIGVRRKERTLLWENLLSSHSYLLSFWLALVCYCRYNTIISTSKGVFTLPGTLYLVATPIGNLDDMPPRVAATFGLADFVAAEDTRVTLRLLNHLASKSRWSATMSTRSTTARPS